MKLNIKKNKLKNAVINGVKKTFKEMAFIDVMIIDDEILDVDFKHILYVNILEPILGKICMYLSYECKKLILENVYGRDMEELHTDEIDDCQLELLNVLVGNILSFYYKNKKKYMLDLPRILFDEEEIKWKGKDQEEYYFDAEGCNFKLLIDLKG